MKIFLKENWYKLMIGSSCLIFSVGFLLQAISPSYANTNKTDEKVLVNTEIPQDDHYKGELYVSGGYAYLYNGYGYWNSSSSWRKYKLP